LDVVLFVVEGPVIAQRARIRDGLESLGNAFSFVCATARSSSEVLTLRIVSLSAARLAAYLFTSFVRFNSRSIIDFLAMLLYFLNGKLNASKSARPSCLFRAVVVMVTSMPRIASIWS